MLTAELDRRLEAYSAAMEAIEIRRAAQELRALWVAGNEYLQKTAPWAAFKEDEAAAAAIIRTALNLIRLYAIVSRPFVPDASDTLLNALKLAKETAEGWPTDAASALAALPAGHAFETPENLFAKLEDAQIAEWKARFGGSA